MRGPFHSAQLSHGARMVSAGEWELPGDYRDSAAEHRAVRERAGLLDRSNRALILITGADRTSWLQGMVSNDVRLLNARTPAIRACILSSTGQIIADITIIGAGNDLLLDMPFEVGDRVLKTLDQFVIVEDVELRSVTAEYEKLSVQGPLAKEAVGLGTMPAGTIVIPADHSGEGGFDLYAPVSVELDGIWVALRDSGIMPIGEIVAETLRIEAGIPKLGVDMDESTIALETRLGPTHISHSKGCYIGQEIIHRIHSRGHTNRELTGFMADGEKLPASGEKVFPAGVESGKEAGWITSSVHSPTMNRPIALGYLRHEHRTAGVPLTSETGISLTVAELPFHRPASAVSKWT